MFSTHQRLDSYLTGVRNVSLISGEKVTHIFAPQDGTIHEPTASGRLLVTTSHRIISFTDAPGNHEILVAPIEELNGVMVKSRSRSPLSLIQGLVFILSGLVIYLVLSYWVTGQFVGPTVPVIDIDVGPLIILMGLLGGGWLLGKHYLAQEGGAIIFQGSNWAFTFPYSGEKASEDVHHLVKSVFTARSQRRGDVFESRSAHDLGEAPDFVGVPGPGARQQGSRGLHVPLEGLQVLFQ